jgi:hypothetical protein
VFEVKDVNEAWYNSLFDEEDVSFSGLEWGIVNECDEVERSVGHGRWTQKERLLLWECVEESIHISKKRWKERMFNEWQMRASRKIKKATVLSKLREIKLDRSVSEMEKESIRRRVAEKFTEQRYEEVQENLRFNVDAVCDEDEDEDNEDENDAENRGETEHGESRDSRNRVDRELVEDSVSQRDIDVWKEGRETRPLLDEENEVLKRVREIFTKTDVVHIPSLKAKDRKFVNAEVRLVNGVMHNVETANIM